MWEPVLLLRTGFIHIPKIETGDKPVILKPIITDKPVILKLIITDKTGYIN